MTSYLENLFKDSILSLLSKHFFLPGGLHNFKINIDNLFWTRVISFCLANTNSAIVYLLSGRNFQNPTRWVLCHSLSRRLAGSALYLPVFWKRSTSGPLAPIRSHQNVVIPLEAIAPTYLEVADSANRFRFHFQNTGDNTAHVPLQKVCNHHDRQICMRQIIGLTTSTISI